MTQISYLEKGTPRLQIFKDTEPWLYTQKQSPYSGMIKRSYINDGGQRHARRKLNLDEEPDDSETPMGAHTLRALARVKYTNMDEDTIALNLLTEKVYHFMKNVCPIIGKDKKNVQPITGKDVHKHNNLWKCKYMDSMRITLLYFWV